MSAAETIAKAIEKLERLKSVSTPRPWHYATDDLTGDVDVWHDQEVRSHVANLGQFGDSFVEPDADLIVTLHRTIDAQLGMLRGVLRVHQEVVGLDFDNEEVWPIPAWALKLAEAILGGEL